MSVECDTIPIPFSALVGRQEGHLACKKVGVGFLVVTIYLELCMSYRSNCRHNLHHHRSIKIQTWRQSGTGLPGLSWKIAVKQYRCRCVT